jgi:hypothetical protein
VYENPALQYRVSELITHPLEKHWSIIGIEVTRSSEAEVVISQPKTVVY